ncbi:uncharacterized protein LOC122278956 isoform X1 [Carya illinoinensis]|uniref:Far1-related sequence 3 n=1 Tax=Carya illinoinensis TaxID=32201 RepID=A0A922DUD8_CARIL|nr:uncharacterized protein LOC122278956 isoform X1 [Carya illinoinensis]KAG6691033.1 hypothetical protein I3842_10G043900 [Carya illinoinensis]KAG6691035.1 hypothetical protein I3842_10G043900 [Carya illinoinensis]
MGSKLEIAVQMRKILIISSRTCYRSAYNHPFLLGILCFVLFLYRSFPFLFSLLVSASPVLFCTAVLLGTLLSFGHPNIVPEIEKDDDRVSHSHDVASLKARVSSDTTVVVDDERDESFLVERYTGKGSDIVEEAIEAPSSAEDKVGKFDTYDGLVDYVAVIAHSSREIQLEEDIEGASSLEDKVGEVGIDDGLVDYRPLNNHSSREIQLEKRVTGEVEGKFNGLELEKKGEFHEENLGIECVSNDGEALENQCFVVHKVGDEILEVEDNVKRPGELADAHSGDLFDLYPNDDEDGDDESSDRGSDLAESSSPDASMADIFPILEELHPLLDQKAPQPAHMSHDDESDAVSERSRKSNNASVESDEESEIHGDEEDGVDENEDDEEEAQGGKEDESKSAIKWTEDDQKNLMDLGTSELERNQRLENLIARRRARKNMRLMAEKNLIDLDGTDLFFNVSPISTARHNPFDLPFDPYDPPGSAPSILLPVRNPFDLPYDPNEEKPDLKGDNFQQEFVTFQQKDTLFRRHESFSIGPSGLGGPRQERHAIRFRPFFVPERFTSEGTSYSSFERQSSEVSESKLSSIPDTELGSSAADQDDNKLNELDLCQETKVISNIDHACDHVERGSGFHENIDSVEMEQAERRDVCHDKVEITLGQVGNQAEMDSGLSTTGGVAIPLELSTSEIHLEMQQFIHDDEVEITLGQVGNQAEMDSGLSETGGVAIPLELSTSEIHLKMEPVEDEYRSRSSLSSLSEIDGRVLYATKEETVSLEPRGNDLEESRSAILPSPKEPDSHFLSGGVDENQHEPVYDSSHPEGEKILSPPSISSDLQVEISKMGSPPVSVVTSISISDKESELYGEREGKDSSNYEETHGSSSVTHPANETEPRLREVQECRKDHHVTQVKSSGVNLGDQNGSEYVVEHVSVTSRASYDDVGSVKEGIVYKKDSSSHKQDQVSSSSNDSEIIFGIHQDVYEKPDSEASSYQMAFENLTLSRKEEQHPQPSVVVEHMSVVASETEPFERHTISKIETFQRKQDQVYSHGSIGKGLMHSNEVLRPEHDQVQFSIVDDAEIDKSSHQDGGEKLDLVASSPQHIPSSEEQQHPLVTEQVILVLSNHSTSESEHVEGWSLKKEEIVCYEQYKVHSSGSDAKIDAGHHQDLDVDVVSLGYDSQYVPSEEKPLSGTVKNLAYADKPMFEASFDDHDECTESYDIRTESSEVVKMTDNEDGLIVHDPKCKIRPDLSSSVYVSTQIDIPDESPGYKLPSSGLDLKADVLGEIVNKDQTKVSEDFSYPAEAYGSSHAEQTVNEVDEIKEIDEGLLSELDAVGDFRVKEVVESTEFELLPKDSNPAKTEMGLPVLEARSLEDINLAFKQLHEGVDAEEVILPSMVDDWLVVRESKDHVESNSSLKTVDAKSLEDIHIALKHVSQDNVHELPLALDPKDLAAVETCQVASAKEIESTDMGSGVQESSTVAADKSEQGCDGTSEILSLSISDKLDIKSTEEKSHGTRSSSSSSSSSSNSD